MARWTSTRRRTSWRTFARVSLTRTQKPSARLRRYPRAPSLTSSPKRTRPAARAAVCWPSTTQSSRVAAPPTVAVSRPRGWVPTGDFRPRRPRAARRCGGGLLAAFLADQAAPAAPRPLRRLTRRWGWQRTCSQSRRWRTSADPRRRRRNGRSCAQSAWVRPTWRPSSPTRAACPQPARGWARAATALCVARNRPPPPSEASRRATTRPRVRVRRAAPRRCARKEGRLQGRPRGKTRPTSRLHPRRPTMRWKWTTRTSSPRALPAPAPPGPRVAQILAPSAWLSAWRPSR
mmetsp:Transcript_860/g.2467  ORF Transcript_860/g.2467 Transcript_860/m.2467 type:complete len:290 (-) Transcript_860:1050-1919(-)